MRQIFNMRSRSSCVVGPLRCFAISTTGLACGTTGGGIASAALVSLRLATSAAFASLRFATSAAFGRPARASFKAGLAPLLPGLTDGTGLAARLPLSETAGLATLLIADGTGLGALELFAGLAAADGAAFVVFSTFGVFSTFSFSVIIKQLINRMNGLSDR